MSNPQQPPADGWQPPQPPGEEQPVYRPNEQPPAEDPAPWSPSSQRLSSPPSSQRFSPPPSGPTAEDDGTVKYTGGYTSQPQAPFGPPPGVPVSPFDVPPQAPGMPPVSSVPASGMPGPGTPPPGVPVSPGQFGPQGGQLVPVSAPTQPWGAPQSQIQRRTKSRNRTPMWLLLAGVVVIAGALGVGGYLLFSPGGSGGGDEEGTIGTATASQAPTEAVPEANVFRDDGSGLSFVADSQWAESADAPEVFSEASGGALADGTGSVFVGTFDAAALEFDDDTSLAEAARAVEAALADSLGGPVEGEAEVVQYRVDARVAEFRTFTVGETEVLAAIIDTGSDIVGFVGFATGDQVENVERIRSSVSFGE